MASRNAFIEWAMFLFKAFCASVLFFAVAFTVWTVGPHVETRYFPVVSKLRILDLGENAEGNAIIMAEFEKLRSCEFLGIAWFHKIDDGAFERVPVQLLRQPGDSSSPNRPEGRQRAGPWVIGIPPDEIPTRSFARLTHTCHGLWSTTTEFYP